MTDSHEDGLANIMWNIRACTDVLQDIRDMREWYGVVKCGRNVFKSAACFPPEFRCIAEALDRGLSMKIGGQGVLGRVLDYLWFFEFNRRRLLKASWHSCLSQGFGGRPVTETNHRIEKLVGWVDQRVEALQDLAARAEDEQNEEAKDAEGSQDAENSEVDEKAEEAESCWAAGEGWSICIEDSDEDDGWDG